MNYTEQVVTFSCSGEELLGILAVPERPRAIGVLIVVGGPQTRIGSHRQFLLLSRGLASAGYPVMRFDFRGMGDSTGEQRNFEAISDDIAAAIDVFQADCLHIDRVVLWGLCDAASANLMYWDQTKDPRVHGLVLLNPWVRSEVTLARMQIKHYYGQRLLQIEFWRKLFTGNLAVGRALKGFIGGWLRARQTTNLQPIEQSIPFQVRMMRALLEFPGPMLLILSGEDYTAKEFLEAIQADSDGRKALSKQLLTRVDIGGADHTFSSAQWRQAVQEDTSAWIQKISANFSL